MPASEMEAPATIEQAANDAVHTDESETQLSRQVEPYRRRRRAAVLAIVLSPVVAGAGAWLLYSEPQPGRAAGAIAVPVAEEPTARLAADDPIGEAVQRIADDEAAALRGVSAAADAYGVIALWTDRVVWVSRDDGRSFHQELAGPELLTAVAVGPEGRVYAARHGGRLGVLSPAGRAHWIDIGCEQVLAIDAAPLPGQQPTGDASVARARTPAPWLAVLGLDRDRDAGLTPMLWLSGDHGRSWRRLLAPRHGDAANRVKVSPDGVIHLVTEDTDTSAAADPGGRLRHYIGHVDGRPFELAATSEDPPPMAVGHDGRSWRMAWDGRRMMLRGAENAARALSVRNWDVRLAASRERTLAVADDRLVELRGDSHRVLSRELPGDVDVLAVDGLGRAVAAVGGSAVRYSERHGWRRLFEISAP